MLEVLKEENMIKYLDNYVLKEDKLWKDLIEEETELGIEVANMITDDVIDELVFDILKLHRK
jgi:hypothetical protein